jgi:hypothetical protein
MGLAQQKIAEQDTKQRAAVELALAKIRDERQQVAQAGLSLASRLAEYKALDERERDLQEQAKAQVQQSVLGSLVADLVPLGLASGALAQLAALETLQSRWEALDFQQQRLLLQSFGVFRISPNGRGSSRLEIGPPKDAEVR